MGFEQRSEWSDYFKRISLDALVRIAYKGLGVEERWLGIYWNNLYEKCGCLDDGCNSGNGGKWKKCLDSRCILKGRWLKVCPSYCTQGMRKREPSGTIPRFFLLSTCWYRISNTWDGKSYERNRFIRDHEFSLGHINFEVIRAAR